MLLLRRKDSASATRGRQARLQAQGKQTCPCRTQTVPFEQVLAVLPMRRRPSSTNTTTKSSNYVKVRPIQIFLLMAILFIVDEIPMVLCELNESAMAYLGRDQFDNALLLLQKAHGVLDVVDLSGSRRDQFVAF